MSAHAIIPSAELGTPETYLDPERASGFETQPTPGVGDYHASSDLHLNEFALNGRWHVGAESITPVSSTAEISGGVQARDVYLVMTSTGNEPRTGRVLVGGEPIPAADRGTDVGPGGYFTVKRERLYNLVKLTSDAQFLITVQLPPGVNAYDFTFG